MGGEIWPAFEKVFAPEELFFPTMLALAGFTSTPPTTEGQSGGAGGGEGGNSDRDGVAVKCESLMHATWPKTGEKANPVLLDETFNEDELHRWVIGMRGDEGGEGAEGAEGAEGGLLIVAIAYHARL